MKPSQITPGALLRITNKSNVNPPMEFLVVILEPHREHEWHVWNGSSGGTYCTVLEPSGRVRKMWIVYDQAEVVG